MMILIVSSAVNSVTSLASAFLTDIGEVGEIKQKLIQEKEEQLQDLLTDVRRNMAQKIQSHPQIVSLV